MKSTCRQVHGHELLSAQHGDGAGGEAPEDVHVGRHVEEREVTEGGENHGRAQSPCGATTNSHSYRGSIGDPERIVAAVARLTGGRIGGEVSDHEALQRRHSPAAEHDGVSSNDPWEKRNLIQQPPCESSALCS